MFADLLQFELRLRCRRRQLHLFRWLYAAWLVYLFGRYFLPSLQPPTNTWDAAQSAGSYAWLGGSFIGLVLWQRFLFVVLATPAFVAGQITEEKQRGMLEFVLLTELESGQIVLAKLLAQGYLLSTVLLLDVPLLLMALAFEEFDAQTLLAHTVCMVTLVFALGALSLLAAVRCRTTTGVLVAVYALAAAVFAGGAALDQVLGQAVTGGIAPGLMVQVSAWLRALLGVMHPAYVLDAIAGHRSAVVLTLHLVVFALFWGLVAMLLAVVAARRLRMDCLGHGETGGSGGRRLRTTRHPPVGDDPVAWKASYVEGVLPGGFPLRWGRIAGVLAVVALTAPVTIWAAYVSPSASLMRIDGIAVTGLFALLALLRSSLAMPGERARDTLEALLLTGWYSSDVIDSTFVGVIRAFRPAVLASGVTMVVLSLPAGPSATVSAASWAAMAWVAVFVTTLFGFAVSTSRSSAIVNVAAGTVVCAVLVPVFGTMHFMIAGVAWAIVEKAGPGWEGSWITTFSAVMLTQVSVALLWLGSGWLRLNVLVHDKGWQPTQRPTLGSNRPWRSVGHRL